ncbi:hypothetical protein ACSEE7_18230 [Halomonas cupida]|uniref:hypothetical protein n=1 Tax=Halomonas cupida TaxID=44933 RepID=UPI003EF4AC2D
MISSERKFSFHLFMEICHEFFKKFAFFIGGLYIPSAALADDYFVSLNAVKYYESLRPLVESCQDLGVLEAYRPELDMALDFENLRSLFESIGYAKFNGCPSDVKIFGVED